MKKKERSINWFFLISFNVHKLSASNAFIYKQVSFYYRHFPNIKQNLNLINEEMQIKKNQITGESEYRNQ